MYAGSDIWEPLWLRPDEVLEAVRTCFGAVAGEPRFLAEGMLNQSWRVDTPDGGLVLRVTRPELSRDQVAYEHAFTRTLHDHIPEVVVPRAGRDGDTVQVWNGRLLSLFPFVDGTLGTGIDPQARTLDTAAALARIHRVSSDLPHWGQRPGFRRVDEHPRWTWPRLKPVLTRDLAGVDGPPDLCDLFDHEMATLDAWLDTLHAPGRQTPSAAVHGDFNPRNLIFAQDRLAAVIDWDGCHIDYLAYEVAGVR